MKRLGVSTKPPETPPQDLPFEVSMHSLVLEVIRGVQKHRAWKVLVGGCFRNKSWVPKCSLKDLSTPPRTSSEGMTGPSWHPGPQSHRTSGSVRLEAKRGAASGWDRVSGS